MHHEQDMRKMGGLRRYMPITWITALLGSLALIGTPLLSGFYSKDTIIEAVGLSTIFGARFAYFAVVSGIFITALYSFRLYFMVFHGKAQGHDSTPHESPWVITVPLILLAIPSVMVGYWAIEPMLYGTFFDQVIYVDHAAHPAMSTLAQHFHGAGAMTLHALSTLPFWLTVAGVAAAWYGYYINPTLPAKIKKRMGVIFTVLDRQYFIDQLYTQTFTKMARALGSAFWKMGDVKLIDGFMVNGTAKMIAYGSRVAKRLQTGYIYHYAFTMIIGAFVLLTWWLGGVLFIV
jgi:NADH-quinone oxidoreductase subunit L